MGIPGFTKYIDDREQLYFENYELRDCYLLVDGHSISCQLYNWNHWLFDARSNNSYGGDYDKYAYIVENFFGMLKEVKVKPIVVFDGGFEQRKLPTILKRMQDKIKVADKLNPDFEAKQPNQIVFPLFLREAFKDVLRNLDIAMVMCEFEGDLEIASVAKQLNCPVLTFDSDYFLFGAQYIPFKTLQNKVSAVESWRTGTYKCISCKVYKIEKFIENHEGIEQSTLYLLPVLLGNDYISKGVLSKFFETINISSSARVQEQIEAVLQWLKTETTSSAIKKILNSFDTVDKKLKILKKIERIFLGYTFVESKLLKYLYLEPKVQVKETAFDFGALEEEIRLTGKESPHSPHNKSRDFKNSSEDTTHEKAEDQLPDAEESNLEEEDMPSVSPQDTNLEKDNTSKNPVSKLFLKNYRKCQYPSSFMDILTQNVYYCIPQVEDHSKEHSHILTLDVLSAIHKILTNGASDKFTVVAREAGTSSVKWYPQDKYTIEVPSLPEIEQLPLQGRRDVFLKILTIDNNCVTLLEQFPTEWHTFILALKYASSKTTFETPLIYSLILCFIILNYIDQKVGYYRSAKRYDKKYHSFMLTAQPASEHVPFKADKCCFYYFPLKDCIVFMQKIINLFTKNPKETADSFDRNLVHSMAQIQSVLLHVKYLNSLLKYPYPNVVIHQIFDGTFIYNLTKVFQAKSSELQNTYLNVFFKDCPSIFAGLKYVLNVMSKQGIL